MIKLYSCLLNHEPHSSMSIKKVSRVQISSNNFIYFLVYSYLLSLLFLFTFSFLSSFFSLFSYLAGYKSDIMHFMSQGVWASEAIHLLPCALFHWILWFLTFDLLGLNFSLTSWERLQIVLQNSQFLREVRNQGTKSYCQGEQRLPFSVSD